MPPSNRKQQVLADRLDRFEHAAVETLSDPFGLRARVRRLGLDPLADERLQAPGSPVEGVALGHVRTVTGAGRLTGDPHRDRPR